MIPLLNTEFEKLPGHTQGAEGKKKWTGVGLSVIWGTVKDHDGHIGVRSVEGQGSTFTLDFPVTREELPEQHTTVSMSEYMGRGGVDPDCGRYRNSAGTGGPDARKTELPCPDGPQRRSVSGVHIGSPRGPACPGHDYGSGHGWTGHLSEDRRNPSPSESDYRERIFRDGSGQTNPGAGCGSLCKETLRPGNAWSGRSERAGKNDVTKRLSKAYDFRRRRCLERQTPPGSGIPPSWRRRCPDR